MQNGSISEMSHLFPAVLKARIERGEFEFPPDTKYEYEKLVAFRCIERNENDVSPVSRDDFRSYAELGKKLPRNSIYTEDSPEYCAVSLYHNKEQLKNHMKLPRKGRKVLRGFVFMEGGPMEYNQLRSHINWWMFDEVDVSAFVEVAVEE